MYCNTKYESSYHLLVLRAAGVFRCACVCVSRPSYENERKCEVSVSVSVSVCVLCSV